MLVLVPVARAGGGLKDEIEELSGNNLFSHLEGEKERISISDVHKNADSKALPHLTVIRMLLASPFEKLSQYLKLSRDAVKRSALY